MAKVERVDKVVAALRKRARGLSSPSVTVSYSQAYAVYVHEDLQAFHPVGQAKFLEQPARELAPELARIVVTAMRRGVSLAQSLLLAGLRLQRESQQRCPVDTGALRASAATRLDHT